MTLIKAFKIEATFANSRQITILIKDEALKNETIALLEAVIGIQAKVQEVEILDPETNQIRASFLPAEFPALYFHNFSDVQYYFNYFSLDKEERPNITYKGVAQNYVVRLKYYRSSKEREAFFADLNEAKEYKKRRTFENDMRDSWEFDRIWIENIFGDEIH